MSEWSLEELAGAVGGRVGVPGDAGYDEACALFNARFDRRPDVVLSCRSAADVRAGIDFARRHGLLLSVKGGGHGYAANTVGDGGLLLDLSPMKGIEVDADGRIARVEPGVTWGELDRRCQANALATPGGTVSTVGVAGLTLGGGSGYLSRLHGLTVDNLLAAEVVTADGRILRVAPDENPDLYWGIRGGGGNFGVVTSFELRLHPVGPEVLAGQIVHRFEAASEVLRTYRKFMDGAADEIQCYPFVLRIPPIPEFPEEHHGEVAVDLVVFHADPGATQAFQPLLDLGDPILAHVAPQAYLEVQQSFDAGLPAGLRYESRSHDLAELSDAAIETFVAGVEELPGEVTTAYLAPGGGAIARRDPAATPFAGRLAPHSLHVLAGWEDAGRDAQVTSWVRELHRAMAPYALETVYVNLLGTDEPQRVPAAYGGNYERLAELKRKWDPENLFRMNHNIAPAV